MQYWCLDALNSEKKTKIIKKKKGGNEGEYAFTKRSWQNKKDL